MKKISNQFSLILTFILYFILLSGCDAINSIDATTDQMNTTIETFVESTATTTDRIETTAGSVETANQNYIDTIKSSLSEWGLGQTFISYVGNNRDYEWYIDQANTGLHSDANCGPSSVAMAALWANKDSSATPEAAREAFRPSGGWWYSDDINNALDLFAVDYEVTNLDTLYDLRAIIDSGSIAIVNNSMSYIPQNENENEHVNRFYSFDSGHYFIVKGYLLVDDKTYFEVYDPNNWGAVYADEAPKGKDRYFEATALMDSIENWYPYAVVIHGTTK
ncbi:cysteine peptidase family C39 domain-containing protein [Fusibacter bizertensis]